MLEKGNCLINGNYICFAIVVFYYIILYYIYKLNTVQLEENTIESSNV